jgi:ABC-type nitrate/sulfonate/bicarbonate transport system substrate-binding protein
MALARIQFPLASGRRFAQWRGEAPQCNASVQSPRFATVVAVVAPAHAEVKNVKISMDWIIQGTHAPFFVAEDKGYFKAEDVTVDAIDRGNGATNVAVTVASGAYHYGWVDVPSMILFNAKTSRRP